MKHEYRRSGQTKRSLRRIGAFGRTVGCERSPDLFGSFHGRDFRFMDIVSGTHPFYRCLKSHDIESTDARRSWMPFYASVGPWMQPVVRVAVRMVGGEASKIGVIPFVFFFSR